MVVKSPFPDVTIPDSTLPELVFARAYGDRSALIDGPSGRSISFDQLATLVDRFAGALAAHGLRKGEVLAIFAPNLPEYAVLFFGALVAGGVVTTVNSLSTADEIAKQLADAGAKYLVTIAPFLDRATAALAVAPVRELIVLGEADVGTSLTTLLAEDAPRPQVVISPASDLAVLPYSSGTTGLPKGVELTHRNLVANCLQMAPVHPYTTADVLVGILPFFHIYGMVVTLSYGLASGSTIVTLPRFELEPFLQTLQDYRVTRAALVPPIILALAKHPAVDRYDLSALREITSGAAPLGADLAEECARRIGCVVKQGYGLTETSPVTHITPADRIRPAAVGVLVPNTEMRIVDPTSAGDLASGEPGEVLIRGPQVTRGYLNKPDATAATIDSDGWLHTGDIGYVDGDGYLYIVDRLKELIKYKGYQVAPAEIEALLVTHPAVADAAVIPSPDEEAGEVPKAFVVLRGAVGADELMAFVAARVAPYKRVRRVEIVDQIPKSASGKILRRVLIERDRVGG